jgi:hypothetical protein
MATEDTFQTDQIKLLEQRVAELERNLYEITIKDRYYFPLDLELAEGHNIRADKVTGNKIGSEASEKMGFWGATPVVQQAHVGTITETGADQDAAARAVINQIIAVFDATGITADS